MVLPGAANLVIRQSQICRALEMVQTFLDGSIVPIGNPRQDLVVLGSKRLCILRSLAKVKHLECDSFDVLLCSNRFGRKGWNLGGGGNINSW
jgi:hypothetical protein